MVIREAKKFMELMQQNTFLAAAAALVIGAASVGQAQASICDFKGSKVTIREIVGKMMSVEVCDVVTTLEGEKQVCEYLKTGEGRYGFSQVEFRVGGKLARVAARTLRAWHKAGLGASLAGGSIAGGVAGGVSGFLFGGALGSHLGNQHPATTSIGAGGGYTIGMVTGATIGGLVGMGGYYTYNQILDRAGHVEATYQLGSEILLDGGEMALLKDTESCYSSPHWDPAADLGGYRYREAIRKALERLDGKTEREIALLDFLLF